LNHPNNVAFQTYANFTKTFYSIYVYPEHLRYTYIDQQPKNELFGFVSYIGGIFGLFIGISCISLMEIFEISFKLVHEFLKKSY